MIRYNLSPMEERIYDTVVAARVPKTLEPQDFGLWSIKRHTLGIRDQFASGGAHTLVTLERWTEATLQLERGEVVMDDSPVELHRHLPFWLAARGRVLKTGLGLGCVVRGALINPEIEHIDVVEIDPDIIRVVGAEFVGNPRVTIHHADALEWDFGDRRWDFAWHDIWCPGNHGLDRLHVELMHRFRERADRQGAWNFPRWLRWAVPNFITNKRPRAALPPMTTEGASR